MNQCWESHLLAVLTASSFFSEQTAKISVLGFSQYHGKWPLLAIEPQPITPMQPKKTNMKIIMGIIAIIVVVIVVALVIILFVGGGATDSRFVGEWEQFEDYISITWNFKSGGSLEIMDIEAGTWSVSGDKLCINPSSQYGGMSAEMCYNFKFSDDGNTLTLTLAGVETAVLTKK